MPDESNVRCCVPYCTNPATHYVQEKYEVSHDRWWGKATIDGLKVGYCAEHAPADAKPILTPNDPK